MSWHDARKVIPEENTICLVKNIWRYVTIIESPSSYWKERGEYVWYNSDIDACYPVADYPYWIYAFELDEILEEE